MYLEEEYFMIKKSYLESYLRFFVIIIIIFFIACFVLFQSFFTSLMPRDCPVSNTFSIYNSSSYPITSKDLVFVWILFYSLVSSKVTSQARHWRRAKNEDEADAKNNIKHNFFWNKNKKKKIIIIVCHSPQPMKSLLPKVELIARVQQQPVEAIFF